MLSEEIKELIELRQCFGLLDRLLQNINSYSTSDALRIMEGVQKLLYDAEKHNYTVGNKSSSVAADLMKSPQYRYSLLEEETVFNVTRRMSDQLKEISKKLEHPTTLMRNRPSETKGILPSVIGASGANDIGLGLQQLRALVTAIERLIVIERKLKSQLR